MPSLKKALQGKATTAKPLPEVVWLGPNSPDEKRGGITQSMIADFLVCRERCRLKHLLGLQPTPTFNHRIEYGNMWHTCEEAMGAKKDYHLPLLNYAKGLCKQYPLQQDLVNHWYQVCNVQFPEYVKYWDKHPAQVKSKTLASEQVVRVEYKLEDQLSNGLPVFLRGKIDGVVEQEGGVFVREHKTKGDLDLTKIQRQLQFDLQTMTYLSMARRMDTLPAKPLRGVLYNTVRRPLSGGAHSIRQCKNETEAEFYKRLGEAIAGDPEYFFAHWTSIITTAEMDRFEAEFLNLLLTQIVEWYHWVCSPEGLRNPFADPIHYRTPFGVYSPLLDGGATDLDDYLATGSTTGLQYGSAPFKELL